MKIKFYVSGSVSYAVSPGDTEPTKTAELDGMLTEIEIVDGRDNVVESWSAHDGTQYANDREQWEQISAAAEVAGIMLPDVEDDDLYPVLMFGERS